MKNIPKSNRRPRYKIARNPPSVQITPRDQRLFTTLYKYRLLTTTQIQKLIFPASSGKNTGQINSCRRRLAKLYHNRYINRLKLPFFPTEGSTEMVYVLNKLGAEIIAQTLGFELKEIRWRHPVTKSSFIWIDHAISVNHVRIALENEASKIPLEIKEWFNEHALKQRQKHFGKKQMTLKRIPDGYFIVYNKAKNTKTGFFLEVDRGTESQSSKILQKIQSYAHYYFSGLYKQDFGLHFFRVLFIVDSPERLANLTKLKTTSNLIFATSVDKISGNPFTDSIWHTVGKSDVKPQVLYRF